VGATLKLLIIQHQMTQLTVSEAAKIPKNRMTELVNGRGTPAKPEEIERLCAVLGNSRQLGYRYCSAECKLGKYLGYQYSKMNPDNTALSIISNLFGLEQLLGELARMLCNNTVTPEMMTRLSQIKLSIMALEAMYNDGTLQPSSADIVLLTDYLQKENRPHWEPANKNLQPDYITNTEEGTSRDMHPI